MSAGSALGHPLSRTRERFWRLSGGRVRARVVLLLACVLALDTADVSTVGAIAGKLERALSLSNTELGVLVAVPSLVAGVATVPIGLLTDRTNRVRLLAISALLWSVAMALSGMANSFAGLLVIRSGLGVATASAGPAIASLVGDFFPPRERARMYGLILSGELIGAAFGFVVSGESATAFGWRAAFFVLALPSLAIGVAMWRLLPEPLRGGAGRLDPGATRFKPAEQRPGGADPPPDEHEPTKVQRMVDEEAVPPRENLVLREDPARMSLWAATRYTLRVRTNIVLILASALGYFYLSGVQTFGLVYFRGHYGLTRSAATLLLALLGLGALAGVLSSGRIADRWVARGRLDGRMLVGAISPVLATGLFLPALLSHSLALSLPLFVLAAAAFAAANPALDAARLDLMHHRLWGRAEAVRTLFRRLLVALAPLLFGLIADVVVSGRSAGSGQQGFGAGASATGLQAAFLILLVTALLSGVLTFLGRRTYSTDVATAVASEKAAPGVC